MSTNYQITTNGHGFSHLNSSKYHQEAGEGAIAGLLDLLAKYK